MLPHKVDIAVLIVEDEAEIRHLVADRLSQRGFAVHEAATADAALRYIDSGAAVDVMFADIDLPGSMDGARLAKSVRQRRPDMPIVYASGHLQTHDIGPLVSRSVFLTKPYSVEEVGNLLERLTGSARTAN